MPSPGRGKNLVYAAGLAVVGGAFAVLPMWYSQRAPKNLTTQKEALGGHQVMRGAYINSGSSDAGADPDWQRDARTGALVYVGKPTTVVKPEDVERYLASKGGQAAAAQDQPAA